MKRDGTVAVAIYARVSSEQQADAGTVASQLDALQARLTKERLSLEDELCFVDEGYSGATLIRPALERLRDVAATGAIDRLYVHSPDRLARKYAYQVLLVDEFQRCGIELVFLNHELGKTPEEDLLLQVQGMMAEYERAKIRERSRRGKLHAARQGAVAVLSGAPYGYRYFPARESGGEAHYEIVLEEARVVRQIFEWVGVQRHSIGEVTRCLSGQGVLTRTGKTWWDRTTVWGILKNPAYKGEAAFGKTKTGPLRPRIRSQRGTQAVPRRPYSTYDVPEAEWISIAVPPIVSAELFDVVQEQLAENKKRRASSKRGARYLLQGLIVCKQCGYAFYGKPVSRKSAKGERRDYAYYRCIGTDAYRFGGQRVCQNKQVRTDLLEEAVWEDVCSLLSDPKRIEDEYHRRLKPSKKQKDWSNFEQLEARISKVKRGIARLLDAYEEGLLDKNEFKPRMQNAKQRLEKLQSQADAQAGEEKQKNELQLIIGRIKDFAGTVQAGLEQADWSTRRGILCALIRHIEVDEKEVRVVYKVSPTFKEDVFPFVNGPCSRGHMQDCWRRHTSALRHAFFHFAPIAVFQHSGVQPLLDVALHALVRDSVLDELHYSRMVHRVEEPADVRIEHPTHFVMFNGHGDRIQCIVLVAARPKPVRKAHEVFLVYRVEHLGRGPLDYLVLQGRDADGPLAAVRFRDIYPFDRTGVVGPACQALLEVFEVGFERLPVAVPGLAVDARRRIALERIVRLPEPVDVVDLMPEVRES
jgi:site-specific DNA recombinase